jgi:hypothetical protein
MWHAAARQASQLHRFSHDEGEGSALDGTAVGVADQGDAFGGRGLDRSQERGMQGYGQLGAGLLLLVNNRVPGLAAQIRTIPLLQGLILPHIFRAILQNLRPSGERDDLWGDNWRQFLTDLGVAAEAEDPDDADSVYEWIESAVGAFSDLKICGAGKVVWKSRAQRCLISFATSQGSVKAAFGVTPHKCNCLRQ